MVGRNERERERVPPVQPAKDVCVTLLMLIPVVSRRSATAMLAKHPEQHSRVVGGPVLVVMVRYCKHRRERDRGRLADAAVVRLAPVI